MTCIAGATGGGRVVIGGDSLGTGPHWQNLRSDRKVFKKGDFIMGFTSSYRMGQLLQYRLSTPHRHPNVPVFEFMVTDFVDAVRDCFRAGGYMSTENGVESGGEFLVGYSGRLFKVSSDFQVGESLGGIDACGSGDEVAMGVMFTIPEEDPRIKVQRALGASARFSHGVAPPFFLETLEAK
jgi:ATP-dependent protease HslVU (ClpYQ) peptidase subunit